MHAREKVRRRLGLQLLFDFHDIVDAIDFGRASGFDVVELNLGNIRFTRQLESSRERRRVRAAARRAKVTLALHAVDGPSFFIPSDRVRACAVAELERTLDHARDIEARNVVMHLGFDMNFGVDGGGRYTHEEFPGYYREALAGALARLRAYSRNRCRLCVENVGGFRYAGVYSILDRALGGNLGLCFDVGHVNILPAPKRRAEVAFFKRHRRFIYHSHVHDNSGARDEHRALGEGAIDFLPFFRLLARTDALVVFEVRPGEAALRCLDYYESRIAPRL